MLWAYISAVLKLNPAQEQTEEAKAQLNHLAYSYISSQSISRTAPGASHMYIAEHINSAK